MVKRFKLSKASKKHDRFLSMLYRSLYLLNPSEANYYKLIQKGHVPRPHYALGIFEAARLAKQIGYRKISIIEFGCAGGSGLVDIEYYVNIIKQLTNVDFEIYGFDTGEGLPNTTDYRDILYLCRPNQLRMDVGKLESHLSNAKLILGDINDTIDTFIEKNNPAPLACMFNDLDFYSSTLNSFRIFNNSEEYFLPRIMMYFDDISRTSNYTGELGAIKDFNSNHEMKKIDRIPQFAEELSLHWQKWNLIGKRFYYYHDFSHSKYSDYINLDINELPLI